MLYHGNSSAFHSSKAVKVAVVPFVAFDLIKIAIAYIIGFRVKNRVSIELS